MAKSWLGLAAMPWFGFNMVSGGHLAEVGSSSAGCARAPAEQDKWRERSEIMHRPILAQICAGQPRNDIADRSVRLDIATGLFRKPADLVDSRHHGVSQPVNKNARLTRSKRTGDADCDRLAVITEMPDRMRREPRRPDAVVVGKVGRMRICLLTVREKPSAVPAIDV